MANRLLDLFDDAARSGRNVASSPPRSLSDMTVSGSPDPEALQKKIDLTNRVLPRVDYSDFSNFVFFNSALDYFNISGERMLNEYPYDGTYNDQLAFQSQSDGYQNYLLDVWPQSSGCAHFSSSTGIPYVYVTDPLRKIDLSAGEWTIEFHGEFGPVTGSDVISLVQFIDASGTEVYTIGVDSTGIIENSPTTNRGGLSTLSSSYFAVVNSLSGGYGKYFKASSTSSVQEEVDSSNWSPFSDSNALLIGSGTLAGHVGSTINGNFKLRELRIWNTAKTLAELQANYNTRVFKSDDLLYYARFSEGTGSVVHDYSGNKLHGSFSQALWSTDSLDVSPQDLSDYVLEWRDPRVQLFVQINQNAAESFDRDNSNIITRLVPEQYLYLEEERNTKVLKNMLYLLARQFDELKVAIDQFPRSLLATYTGFNDTPDALLEDALKFWGWDSKGSFLSKEAFQYFFGYDVVKGDQADYDNQRLETTLAQVKSQFWRRTLQNLPYIYKRKGTRESVEALLRVYGLDEKLVKLKEFGLKPDAQIQTNRINSEKSATALRLSGAFTVETAPTSIAAHAGDLTYNMWVRFPSPADEEMPPTLSTGSVFHIFQSDEAGYGLPVLLAAPLGGPPTTGTTNVAELQYMRPLTGTTGSFRWVTYNGSVVTSGTWQNVPMFDGQWYQLMWHRTPAPPFLNAHLHVTKLDEDVVTTVYSDVSTGSIKPVITAGSYGFSLGRHPVQGPFPPLQVFPTTSGSEFWTRNVQIWALSQSLTEMNDHTLNPFSYGSDTPERELSMSLNWQFDQDRDAAVTGAFESGMKSSGTFPATGIFYVDGNPIPFSSASYYRDIYEYNFIAPPEYGWNEEKIRTLSGTFTPVGEKWNENTSLSLEFNLIDALNEDISYMLSSLDNWNNVIGAPANRYRESYPDLDRLRRQYFSRLTGRINFRAFADFLDFFDRSFVDMIARLLPAEAKFKGAEFVVESHMLERPKVQYHYRRFNPQLVPEGRILIYSPSYVSYVPTSPTLLSISPTSGPDSGGTEVILSGLNFQLGSTVRFGDYYATILSITETEIVVLSPNQFDMPGTVNVVVTRPNGQSSNDNFTFTFTGGSGSFPYELWFTFPSLVIPPFSAVISDVFAVRTNMGGRGSTYDIWTGEFSMANPGGDLGTGRSTVAWVEYGGNSYSATLGPTVGTVSPGTPLPANMSNVTLVYSLTNQVSASDYIVVDGRSSDLRITGSGFAEDMSFDLVDGSSGSHSFTNPVFISSNRVDVAGYSSGSWIANTSNVEVRARVSGVNGEALSTGIPFIINTGM